MGTMKQMAYVLMNMFRGIPFRILLKIPACRLPCTATRLALCSWRGAEQRRQSIGHPPAVRHSSPSAARKTKKTTFHKCVSFIENESSLQMFSLENSINTNNVFPVILYHQ